MIQNFLFYNLEMAMFFQAKSGLLFRLKSTGGHQELFAPPPDSLAVM